MRAETFEHQYNTLRKHTVLCNEWICGEYITVLSLRAEFFMTTAINSAHYVCCSTFTPAHFFTEQDPFLFLFTWVFSWNVFSFLLVVTWIVLQSIIENLPSLGCGDLTSSGENNVLLWFMFNSLWAYCFTSSDSFLFAFQRVSGLVCQIRYLYVSQVALGL